jgi:hypothetical protein
VIIVDTAKNEKGDEVIVFRKAERSPDHPPVELAGAGVAEGDPEALPET